MRLRMWTLVMPLVGLLLLVHGAAVAAGEGGVSGRVSLTDPEGTTFYGDWVRVFLTTAALAVPAVDLDAVDAALERRSRINSGHMDFFVNFQQKQTEDGYVVDHKLTRPNGTFAFHGIPPGRYWIVVTFPTMIAGYKCAWQVAAEVNGGENTHVELNGENLAVPAY